MKLRSRCRWLGRGVCARRQFGFSIIALPANNRYPLPLLLPCTFRKLPSIILQKRPPDRDVISSSQFPTCQLVRKREKSPRNALVSFGSSRAIILLVIPTPASLCANKGGAPSGAQLGPRARAHFQAYLIFAPPTSLQVRCSSVPLATDSMYPHIKRQKKRILRRSCAMSHTERIFPTGAPTIKVRLLTPPSCWRKKTYLLFSHPQPAPP